MATSKEIRTVICDAGPVLHLDEINCLNLLGDFQRVIIPEGVANEIRQHRPELLHQPDISFQYISVPPLSDLELLTLCRMFALHSGEIEALNLMQRFSEAIFLTDDSAARLVAKRMGYNVHGTIGILLRSIRRHMRTPQDIILILQMLPNKSTLHVKPSLLQDIIQQIEEEYRSTCEVCE